MFRLATALLLAAAMTWVAPSAAQDGGERALALHDEAKALYAKGKYREAVEKLRLAVELDPNAVVLYYNLGLMEEKLGNIDSALAYFRHCLELEKGTEARKDLEATIERLEGAKSAVKFGDRTSLPPIIPKPPGTQPEEKGMPTLVLWAYVAGATAVAGAIVGTVLAARAGAVEPGDAPTTALGVTPDDLQADADAAHDLAVGADIAFAIAGTALVTMVVLALIEAAPDGEETSRIEIELGPLGGRCAWRF